MLSAILIFVLADACTCFIYHDVNKTCTLILSPAILVHLLVVPKITQRPMPNMQRALLLVNKTSVFVYG